MATIGPIFCADKLVLTRGRDFKWVYQLTDTQGVPVDFPPGELYFEFSTAPAVTKWEFSISGSIASIKRESEDVDLIGNRTKFQLVWLPDGEIAGGDPVSLGTVQVQK
jgi:hypothetical protein